MARKKRELEGGGDAVGWIAYTDFVTALALVFVALFIFTIAQSASGRTIVEGSVKNTDEDPISGCEIHIRLPFDTSLSRFTRSTDDGAFVTVIRGLEKDTEAREGTEANVEALCIGYAPKEESVTLAAGDTAWVPIVLGQRLPGQECVSEIDRVLCENAQLKSQNQILRDSLAGTEGIEIYSITGGSLFPTNQYELNPEGENDLRKLGESLSQYLTDDNRVLAILGHTDDRPMLDQIGRDHNWILSAERAASAARFLMENYPRYRCKIVALGVGASRPKLPINRGDGLDLQTYKREQNRRLEFRVLNGNDLSESRPSGC